MVEMKVGRQLIRILIQFYQSPYIDSALLINPKPPQPKQPSQIIIQNNFPNPNSFYIEFKKLINQKRIYYTINLFPHFKPTIPMNANEFVKSVRDFHQVDETVDMSVQNYHKLIKMKKLLADTETKMFNRIKLFQKASQKLLKKRQHEIKLFEKLSTIKNNPIFSKPTRPKTRQSTQRPLSRQCQIRNRSKQNILEPLLTHHRNSGFDDEESPKKILAEKINEERMKNAKLIKEDRERNKIIIEQRKKKQLTRKLQSANLIRRQRQNAKVVKEQVQKDKHQDFKRFMEEKYERQREGFMKLQVHLQELQEKEKEALITWKKTIQS